MPAINRNLEIYQELADCHERRGQAQLRDRFFVLAADAALRCGRADLAERLRAHLLQQNPHHLLKPYASFTESMQAPDVQHYVGDLRKTYPPESAEHLLETLRQAENEESPAGTGRSAPATGLRSPLPAKESPEVLKFYRVKEESEDKALANTSKSAAKPKTANKTLAPAPPDAPVRQAKVDNSLPARPVVKKTPVAPATTRPILEGASSSRRPARLSQVEEQELALGYWVATGLFVVFLIGGIALGAYTLLRPFLPSDWFGTD